jgi:hypothetical protein
VYWSVDTNGRVFHSHGGIGDDPRPHVIVDDEGVEWSVREVATPQEWAHGDHCLVLSSRDCVRRIWSYPDNWRRLEAESLLDLDVTRYDRPVETARVREP